MKRLVVKCNDGNYVNIEADRLDTFEHDSNFIVAMSGTDIVGVFDMANVEMLYLSEDRSNKT